MKPIIHTKPITFTPQVYHTYPFLLSHMDANIYIFMQYPTSQLMI